MALEGVSEPTQGSTQSTQGTTQSTQEASYTAPERSDGTIWGSLIPLNALNPHISRIDLKKDKHLYIIGRGRHTDSVDIRFSHGNQISES